MAARIQDVVGLTFGTILKARCQPEGSSREIPLQGKKASARTVVVSSAALKAVETLKEARNAGDDQVMFPGGETINPANKWA